MYKIKRQNVKFYATFLSKIYNVNPFYYFILGIKSGKTCNINHLQFEYGLFHYWFRNFSLSYLAAFSFLVGLSINNMHLITTIHEIPDQIGGKTLRHNIVELCYRLICQLSNIVIVHSRSNKSSLMKKYSIDASKIIIVPIGSMDPILLDKNECKKKLNLSMKKIILLFGFVNQRKGYDLVIRALPKLGNEFSLLIAGGLRAKSDEQYYLFLKKLLHDLNCDDQVLFLIMFLNRIFP